MILPLDPLALLYASPHFAAIPMTYDLPPPTENPTAIVAIATCQYFCASASVTWARRGFVLENLFQCTGGLFTDV